MPVSAVVLGVVATGSVGLGAPAAYEYFTSKSGNELVIATPGENPIPKEPKTIQKPQDPTPENPPSSSPTEGDSSQNSSGSPKVENSDLGQSQTTDGTSTNKEGSQTI